VQGSIGVCYAVYTEYDGRPTERVVLEGLAREVVTPTSIASQYIHPSCEVACAVCMLVTQDIGGANVSTIAGNEAFITRGLRSTVFK
jgi:hypothetical protein